MQSIYLLKKIKNLFFSLFVSKFHEKYMQSIIKKVKSKNFYINMLRYVDANIPIIIFGNRIYKKCFICNEKCF